MAEQAKFTSWFGEKLSDLLGFPAGSEMINYILAYESAREIKEHLSSLLDTNDPATRTFMDEFFKKWTPSCGSAQVYKKSEIDSPTVKKKNKKQNRTPLTSLTPNQMSNVSSISQSGSSQAAAVSNERCLQGASATTINMVNKLFTNDVDSVHEQFEEEPAFKSPPLQSMTVDTTGAEFLDKNRLMPEEISQRDKRPFKQKHFKYVPLYNAKGKLKTDTVKISGRHACQCLAQKHGLINNCADCGRIVCEQEGAGPCMFCGTLVCSMEDMEIIARKSKKGNKLYEDLLSQHAPECIDEVEAGLKKAVAHKERLLDYDKNCTKRTKVYDDEADYFSADNRWLNKKQKDTLAKRDAELREKRFGSRLDRKITIDFAGRQVVEDVSQNYMYDEEDEVVQAVNYGNPAEDNAAKLALMMESHPLIDPRLNLPPLQYQGSDKDVTESLKAQHKSMTQHFQGSETAVTASLKAQHKSVTQHFRVQDKELQEIVDKGICLSMHQPWASLLVYGIKKLEGRSWYTPHRGRLWIASTAKEPDKEQVHYVEEQYRNIYRNEDVQFPRDTCGKPHYPTAALLGCVNMTDCATNEDYFKDNPDVKEENESEYLFVCENAEQLQIKFSIKGQHKTYKLEPHIHAAAKNGLLQAA